MHPYLLNKKIKEYFAKLEEMWDIMFNQTTDLITFDVIVLKSIFIKVTNAG